MQRKINVKYYKKCKNVEKQKKIFISKPAKISYNFSKSYNLFFFINVRRNGNREIKQKDRSKKLGSEKLGKSQIKVRL